MGSPLPERARPGESRTVWVEVDVEELEEVRGALAGRIESLAKLLDVTDPYGVFSNALERTRAVLDRLPNAAAMARRYP
jgi:hypothetical protein